MKRSKLSLLLLASYLLVSAPILVQADDPTAPKSERKYKQSFVDQDLSQKTFTRQNYDNCNFENADLTGATFEGCSLKNCNFRGAMLKNAYFRQSDLTGSNFQEATIERTSFSSSTLNQVNFEGLDLSSVQLHELKLREANLRNVRGVWFIYGADFFGADLRGANFSQAIDFTPANFRKSKYDQHTQWHANFDPKARGAIYQETLEDDPTPAADTTPQSINPSLEAAFAKLDANQDGVLSGNEATQSLDRDQNRDGEITFDEFATRAKKR